jgi:hypothetical protein
VKTCAAINQRLLMHRRAESGSALRGNEFNQAANFIVGRKYALPRMRREMLGGR